ncbi:hypothetical protein ICW40_13540 [Actinotalea ferrariae]|uniref:hypothetical protein n=1 Tax=Actinotalea ferrariae TaxID=1386098 RepID=UPI001C8C5895|nr:hypothetical protein [Actinotalea ferrariae]MBX9245826.1 hypothetical protein [Actinotalea ferrariae]
MRQVQPRRPWQIPVAADELIASALALGRSAALVGRGPRLNGASDAMVEESYAALSGLVRRRITSDDDLVARLQALEGADSTTSWSSWQTIVLRSGADDDPDVISAAQDVWDALGPNAFGLEFKHRPRTYGGFLEGRLWLNLYVLGCVALVVAGLVVRDRYGIPWWLSLGAVGCWTGLLWRRFTARYSKRARVADQELPHF